MRLLPTAATAEERRVTELQLWVISHGVSVFLVDLEPYEPCRVAGVVTRLRLDPTQGHIEATVTDGTGEVTAQWRFRRATPERAITPGRAVVLEGIAVVGHHGELMLPDPAFRTFDFPEVA